MYYQKRNIQLAGNLVLSEVTPVTESKIERVETPSINHVFVIDVSGSMYDTLPKMRTHLKARIPELISENDTLSIIWFASSGQCGKLKDMVKVTNLSDIKELNSDIDRYLTPKGCTAFLDPLVLTNELIGKVKTNEGLWSFVFLSDGGNNDSPWNEVIKQLEELQPKLSSATIVEYGYYCDSDKLTEMAETLGGSKIFEEDFDDYEVDIERLWKSNTSPRIEFNITDFKSQMKLQVMFTIDESSKSVKVYNTDRKNSILIPENTEKIYFLGTNNSKEIEYNCNPELLAAIYVFADKMKYDITEQLLKTSGDVNFIEMYCNSFGKQKLANFKNSILDSVFDLTKIGQKGFDYNFNPNPKAYCVMDMIEDLMSSELNLIHPYHPAFNYSRIGAKSVTKKLLTESEKEALSNAKTTLKVEKVLEEVDLNSVKMNVKDHTKGYSVRNLTWNENRANVSMLFKIDVSLSLPKNNPLKIENLDSFIWRNYTLIKDGILNMTELPVTLSIDTFNKFDKLGLVEVISRGNADVFCIIKFGHLPIINKKRTETVYASEIISNELRLLELRNKKKYIGYLSKQLPNPKVSLTSSWNSEQLNYLKSIGVSNYNGYSPLTELDKSGDFYFATSLVSSIEKFSSIPKIEDIFKKRESGKAFTASEEFLDRCMKEVDLCIEKSSDKLNSLETLSETISKETKDLIERNAKSKFSIILSRKWFTDRKGFDDNTSELPSLNNLKITFQFKEEKQYL